MQRHFSNRAEALPKQGQAENHAQNQNWLPDLPGAAHSVQWNSRAPEAIGRRIFKAREEVSLSLRAIPIFPG